MDQGFPVVFKLLSESPTKHLKGNSHVMTSLQTDVIMRGCACSGRRGERRASQL